MKEKPEISIGKHYVIIGQLAAGLLNSTPDLTSLVRLGKVDLQNQTKRGIQWPIQVWT